MYKKTYMLRFMNIMIQGNSLTDIPVDSIDICLYDPDKSRKKDESMAISAVAEMLGIKSRIETEMDLVALSEKGLPKKVVPRLVKRLSVSLTEIAPLLLVSRKTVERYRTSPESHLSPPVSERVLQIALVVKRCEEVFEDPKLCNEWLKSMNPALGGRIPLELLKTGFGINMVLSELTRIEHGVIS